MTRREEAAALDARVLAFIRRGATAAPDDAVFDRLALDLFSHQVTHSEALARFARGRGLSTASLGTWRDIPAVPAVVFKHSRVSTFAPDEAVARYRTSGTTAAARGVHELDTIDLYKEGALRAFEAALLPDGARLRALVLAPSPEDAPESSLSAMLGFVCRSLAAPGSASFGRDGALDMPRLVAALRDAEDRGEPVQLLGTSFAFVHLCDHLAERSALVRLPAGSRVMETGGYKGRSREVPRAELVAMIGERLLVPPTHVVNEYGMTELSSQLYSDSLIRLARGEAEGPVRWWAPPWIRARALDPRSLDDVPPGEVGVLALVDLANRGSAVAIRTADLGVAHEDGRVEVLGRAQGLEARGCSLSFDLPSRVVVPAAPSASVTEACQALVAARASSLAGRPVAEIAASLGRVSARWLDPDDPIRNEALRVLPATSGLSPAVLAAGFDRSFSAWSERALLDLLSAELGPHRSQDAFLPHASALTRPLGPSLVLVVGASNLPTPLAFDVMCALLVRGAVLVKPPSDEPLFADLFRRSIAEVDPALGACVAVRTWPGGSAAHEAAALASADAIIATGEDDSVLSLRARAPVTIRFVGRGSRLSVGLVGREALTEAGLSDLAARAALDIALWDQRGCLSPVAWLIEDGGEVGPEQFAHALDAALAELGASLPEGTLPVHARVAAAEERARIEAREIAGEPVLLAGRVLVEWSGPLSIAPARTAALRVVSSLEGALPLLEPFAGRLSNVLLEVGCDREAALVDRLLALRPTRLCPVGLAQSPPAAWHHDGEPVLLPLLRFVDWERRP